MASFRCPACKRVTAVSEWTLSPDFNRTCPRCETTFSTSDLTTLLGYQENNDG